MGEESRIRQAVAQDRRVSVEDGEMRHGRKSQSKRFNGFKQHIAAEMDLDLIVACTVTPANRPEAEATPELQKDMQRQGMEIGELYIDRGYIKSPVVESVLERRGEVLCKPWASHNGELLPKSVFKLDMRSRSMACPGGQRLPFRPLGLSSNPIHRYAASALCVPSARRRNPSTDGCCALPRMRLSSSDCTNW